MSISRKSCYQNIKTVFVVVFILVVCSLCLPWFHIGGDVTPIKGIEPLIESHFWIFFVCFGIFAIRFEENNRMYDAIFAEIFSLGIWAFYGYAFLFFKRSRWTIFEKNFDIDFVGSCSSAMISFWVALFLIGTDFLLFQFWVFCKRKKNV